MPQTNELKILISAEVDRYIKALNDAENKTTSFGSKAKSTLGEIGSGLGLNTASLGLAGVTAALLAAGTAAVKASADFEQYKISFEVMTGSAEKGLSLLNSLRDFANVTPFTTDDLARASTVLLQFGTDLNEVMPTLKILGDVSGGNAQKLDSLVLAFGQMSSTGRLMGQDLLQMINAGFNPLQEISKRTGKSMSELKDEMEKGAISSGMVKQAFIDATAEGGRFHDMMKKQSETTIGTWSTLVDTWGKVAVAVGDTLAPGVKDAISMLTKLGEVTLNTANYFIKLANASDLHDAKMKLKFYNNVSKGDIGANIQYRLGNPFGNVADDMEKEMNRIKRIEENIIKPTKLSTDISKINVNTGSTKPTKKSGKKSTSIKIDKETIGYGDYTSEFKQRLKEESLQIDEEKNLIAKSLQVKAELRKQGLRDTSRDFQDELALKIDHYKRQSDLEQQVNKESAAAITQIRKKQRDDILSFQNGNATNKSEAIAAVNIEADKQVEAIEAMTKAKLAALLEGNQRLSDARKQEIEDQRKFDDIEAARKLDLVKTSDNNAILIGEEELKNRRNAVFYQSIEEKKQIEIDFINFKKDLDIQLIEQEQKGLKETDAEFLELMQKKANIEAEASLNIANAKQTAREEEIQKERDFYSELGNISGNYLELMMSHELTKAKIAEMGQAALQQVMLGGIKAMFEDKKRAELLEAFMATKKAAIHGWNDGLAMAPPPFNLATAAGMAVTEAAFPAANMAMIAASNYREFGGPVTAGQAYIVGEKRPEIFVPDRNGTILPNTNILNSSGNQQGQNQSITPVIINIKAFDSKDVKQYLMENKDMIQNMVAGGIKDNQNGLRNAIKAV